MVHALEKEALPPAHPVTDGGPQRNSALLPLPFESRSTSTGIEALRDGITIVDSL